MNFLRTRVMESPDTVDGGTVSVQHLFGSLVIDEPFLMARFRKLCYMMFCIPNNLTRTSFQWIFCRTGKRQQVEYRHPIWQCKPDKCGKICQLDQYLLPPSHRKNPLIFRKCWVQEWQPHPQVRMKNLQNPIIGLQKLHLCATLIVNLSTNIKLT